VLLQGRLPEWQMSGPSEGRARRGFRVEIKTAGKGARMGSQLTHPSQKQGRMGHPNKRESRRLLGGFGFSSV